MTAALPDSALDQLFREARSIQQFHSDPVSDDVIHQLYELVKLGPTGFNSQPGRYLFLRSPEAKARLAPALSSGNRDKTLAAPITAIVAADLEFHVHLPSQFPAYDAKGLFDEQPGLIEPAAVTNATLQAAYLIFAARALGLDAGPMSGFKADLVNKEFFPEGRHRALLLVNLGYGRRDALPPRGARLDFSTAVSIL